MRFSRVLIVGLVLTFTLNSCKTGKKAYEKGNYYISVIQSVNKLRSQPKNKKAKATLQQAYPLALQTMALNNENLMLSNDLNKYKKILGNYNKINRMYEEILRSPEALKIIPKPVNYYAKIDEVKKMAADESYAIAMEYLLKGTREDGKRAHYFFKEVKSYINNYKDVDQRIEEARVMATLYVMVVQDPVPANFAVSGNYFKNKIDEYLNTNRSSTEFIEFYSPEAMVKAGIRPDHKVTLRYQDFSIGNVYMKESKEQLSKDSVIVATIKNPNFKGTINQESIKNSGINQMNAKADNNSQKVTVCHKSDKPNQKNKTLNISPSALQAHLDHGDTVGPCEDDKTPDDSENPKDPEKPDDSNDPKDPEKPDDSNDPKDPEKPEDNPEDPKDPEKPDDTNDPKDPEKPEDNPGDPKDSDKPDDDNGKDEPSGLIDIYATVRALMTTYDKTITSQALLSMTITSEELGKVLKEEQFPVEHIWRSTWATFNGDERALTEEQHNLCELKEQQAPSRDEIFNLLSEQFYNNVTKNISGFYSNY